MADSLRPEAALSRPGGCRPCLGFIIERDLFDGRIYNVLTLNATVRDIVEAIREFVPETEIAFVDSPIMNQLSYEVSSQRFLRCRIPLRRRSAARHRRNDCAVEGGGRPVGGPCGAFWSPAGPDLSAPILCRFWRRTRPHDSRRRARCAHLRGQSCEPCGAAGRVGFQFVHGDICDRALLEKLFRRTRLRHGCALCRRKPCRPFDRFVRAVRTHQCARNPALLDAALAAWKPRLRGRALPPYLDRRSLRLARARRSGLHRDDALRSALALCGEQGGAATFWCGPMRHTHGLPVTDHQLLEQLRPLSVSREADPADDHQCAQRARRCRSTAMARMCVTGSMSRIIARRWRTCIERGRAGETYNIGGGAEMANIELVTMLCARVDARFAGDSGARRTVFLDCPAARVGVAAN